MYCVIWKRAYAEVVVRWPTSRYKDVIERILYYKRIRAWISIIEHICVYCSSI